MKSFLTKVLGWCLIGLTGMVCGCGKNILTWNDQGGHDQNDVPCLIDGQCNTGQTCDRSQCLSCCLNSADACIDVCCGKCVQTPVVCKTDADCAHGSVCEPTNPGMCDDSSKHCVPGCHQASDCDTDQTCTILNCFTCPCPGQCLSKPSCSDQTYSRACTVDADCTCGVNVVTKTCDYGIAACIDSSQQCPDFCGGIAGNLEIVCKDNQCVQITRPASTCTTDADCKYGAEWCVTGACVPCDNSGQVCTIACLLVEPRNGCQPCKCQTSFCGWSSNGPCASDADCTTGGCSGQVCQSKNEEPIITTCEWRDCYSAQVYGVTCGCIDKQCRWK